MDMDGIGTLALFLSSGAIGVGLIMLAGFRIKLKNRLDDIIDHQNAQIAELQEQVDFAERLLAKGDKS